MHSLGTTSLIYQCPPRAPQLGHRQFALPSLHSLKWGAMGQGNTETGRVWAPESICGIPGREEGLVSYGSELQARTWRA